MNRKSILKSLEDDLRYASGNALSMLNAQLENLEISENHNKFLQSYVNYVDNCIKENKIPMNIDDWKKQIEE